MRPFLYRCPNTGQNVQASTANDADDDLCLAGGQQHSANRSPARCRCRARRYWRNAIVITSLFSTNAPGDSYKPERTLAIGRFQIIYRPPGSR